MITKLAQFTDIRVALVVGGLSLNVQAATLRTSPEIVVATPVRFMSVFLSFSMLDDMDLLTANWSHVDWQLMYEVISSVHKRQGRRCYRTYAMCTGFTYLTGSHPCRV